MELDKRGKAGVPKVLVVASWRTGSSFLGEMMARIPGTFYSFEPLMEKVLGNGTGDHLGALKRLFDCDFSRHHYVRRFRWLLRHNKWYHAACAAHPAPRSRVNLCADRTVLRAGCGRAEARAAKVVRFRMGQGAVEELVRAVPGIKAGYVQLQQGAAATGAATATATAETTTTATAETATDALAVEATTTKAAQQQQQQHYEQYIQSQTNRCRNTYNKK